ncbi:MAG: hypothetical protein IPO66_01855 [Rhodanobacteraceae bacterium]|nr:hypothetical protein [Rhodanobacteraceae bacterium]
MGTVWIEDIAGVCGRLLELESLTQSVLRLERAERLQRSLYAIADMASSDLDMPDMLRSIHDVVGELMYAENFFIVQVDPDSTACAFSTLPIPKTRPLGPDEVIPIRSIPNSLTVAMLRSRQLQMGPSDQLRERLGVAQDASVGPDSVDWLGVPLVGGGVVRGAIVVQSYYSDRARPQAGPGGTGAARRGAHVELAAANA